MLRPNLVLLLLGMGSTVALLARYFTPGPIDEHIPPPPPAHIHAPVVVVRSTEAPVRASAVGVLAARRRSVVSARLTALVSAVRVREGDRVRAGQELILLDDRDPIAVAEGARAAILEADAGVLEAERAVSASGRAADAAAANARLAAVTRARMVPLFEKGGISAQARDEAIARDEAARAELARSREAMAAARARTDQAATRVGQSRAGAVRAAVSRSDTRLTAPFDGVIASRPVDPGTLASPGLPLLTIEEPDPRLECFVPAGWIQRVHTGDAVPVELDTPVERLQARVDEIAPSADPRSHTVLVRLALPAGPPRRAGSYGRARFVIGRQPSLMVPAGAVAVRGQLEIVFVVDAQNRARLRLVKTGEVDGEQIEVLAGIESGERIAAGSVDQLTDGITVEVQP